ncbi:MAG: hypothetical protein IJT98_08320 [Prevotella sp.]|nr:hypothetical protein [Prevotella sp.]
MKKILTIAAICLLSLTAAAQAQIPPQQQRHGQQQFSPERFDADLQAFITSEAHLTPQEAAAFFPVYKEMQDKQRELSNRQREISTTKPADDEGCMNVIRESDEIDLEIKRIQQTYHNRFMEIVSPSKLYDILNAEKRFFRRMMRNWGRGNTQHGHRPQGQR